jgi:hypothetical protein
MAKGDIRGSGRSALSGSDGWTIPLTLSAAPQAGDIILVFVHTTSGDEPNTDGTHGDLNNYTSLGQCNTGDYPEIWAFAKVATGSEGTSVTPGLNARWAGRSAVAFAIEGSYSNLDDVDFYAATVAASTSITIPSTSQSVSVNSVVFAAAGTNSGNSPTEWSNSFGNTVGGGPLVTDDGDASGLQVARRTYTGGSSGIETVATYAGTERIGGVLVTVGYGVTAVTKLKLLAHSSGDASGLSDFFGG